MPHDRTEYIHDLAGLCMESRATMQAVGFEPTVAEVLGFARLVLLNEAEVRRMEFMVRERWLREETLQ
jgi:hypothetical protein